MTKDENNSEIQTDGRWAMAMLDSREEDEVE